MSILQAICKCMHFLIHCWAFPHFYSPLQHKKNANPHFLQPAGGLFCCLGRQDLWDRLVEASPTLMVDGSLNGWDEGGLQYKKNTAARLTGDLIQKNWRLPQAECVGVSVCVVCIIIYTLLCRNGKKRAMESDSDWTRKVVWLLVVCTCERFSQSPQRLACGAELKNIFSFQLEEKLVLGNITEHFCVLLWKISQKTTMICK